MNLPYFYEESITQSTQFLSEETSGHCIRVLRMKAGEKLQLTDGKGNLYTATIINADKKNCKVKTEVISCEPLPASHVAIAVSLLKNPTRLEWFMEKATEIGVKEIIPLICAHTEKENFRFERMHNILVSAMLQSRQTWLPELHHPKKFDAIINDGFDGLKLIAHCTEDEKRSLKDVANQNRSKLILIGPEGDFSKTEIESALKNNFIPVSLGNTRLRTETAAIVAAALLSV